LEGFENGGKWSREPLWKPLAPTISFFDFRSTMTVQARRIIVHGMVQGVGFRYFVQRAGKRLKLAGDVRNLPDSTVEIFVEGPPRKLEEFIEEVRQGPSMARVERLEIQEIQATGRYSTFMMEGW
jgi:acylphosphatase